MSGISLRWGAVVMVVAALLLIAAVAFGHGRSIQAISNTQHSAEHRRETASFTAAGTLFWRELQAIADDAARLRRYLVQTSAGNGDGVTAAFLASRRSQLFAAFWSVYLGHENAVLLSLTAASVGTSGINPALAAACQLVPPTSASPSARWLQTQGNGVPVPINVSAVQITLDQSTVQLSTASRVAVLLPNQTLAVPWQQLLPLQPSPLSLPGTTAQWSIPRGATSIATVSVGVQPTSAALPFFVSAQLNIGAVIRESLAAQHSMGTTPSGSYLLLLNESTLSVVAGANFGTDLNSYPCDALTGDSASCLALLASMEAAFVPDWWKASVLLPALLSGSISAIDRSLPTNLQSCGVAGRTCMSLVLPLPTSAERIVLLWIASPLTAVTAELGLAVRMGVVGILLIVACVASGFWAAGWLRILQPMGPLTDNMADIQALNFECLETSEETLQRQTTSELRALHHSFFHMVGNIKAFSQYVSKPVLLDLLQCGKMDAREMESKNLTLIVIDIAGFTTMCEALSTEQLVELAETYFDAASRTLILHGCTLDKYVGDAIMGFWGAPLPYERQAYSSCTAALHLLTVVHRLQPLFRDNGVDLSVRIGLHCGAALVGNIGCSQRVAYTAIGSNVTLTSHLEEESKRQKTSILVSEAVASAAEADSPDLFIFRCVGKVSTLVAYELVGVARSAVADVLRLTRDNTVSDISSATKVSPGTSSSPHVVLLGEGSEKERTRRRQSVSTDPNGTSSHTASARRTDHFASNDAAPSSATGSSRGRRTRPVRLNEYEEVLLIQHTFHVGRESALVIETLSNAVHTATITGDPQQALPELNLIIERHKDVLIEYNINIPVLQRLAQQWARQMQSEAMPALSPSRSQAFGGSPTVAA